MPKAEYTELGRVRTSPSIEVVISTVERPDATDGNSEIAGITISKYITSERFTGFSKESVFIPTDQIPAFNTIMQNIFGGG